MKLAQNYDQTAKIVQSCLNDTAYHAVCVHMWESKAYEMSDPGAQRAAASRERGGVLGVICGTEGVIYDDTHCEDLELGPVTYRFQRHDPEQGMIGLATTVLHPHQNIHPYLTEPTGLLLLDPEPVYTSYQDTYSYYCDSPIPPASMTSEGRMQPGYVRVANENSKFEDVGDPWGYKSIVRELTNIQLPDFVDAEQPDEIFIDPKDAEQRARATQALRRLMEIYSEHPGERLGFDCNEIVANVRPEHVAGIVLNWPEKTKNLATVRHADGSINWKAYFASNDTEKVKLAKLLSRAIQETDQVQIYLDTVAEKSPEATLQTPSVFIYDQYAEHKLIHFPPTRENRKLIENVLKQHESPGAWSPGNF